MNDTFYIDWLEIGDPAMRYTDSFTALPLAPGEISATTPGQPPSTGIVCRNVNRLRNGNAYAVFPELSTGMELTLTLLSDRPILALYANETEIIARSEHYLTVYNKQNLTQTAEIEWTGRRSQLFLTGDGFWSIGNLLEHRAYEGSFHQRIKVLLADSLGFFDPVVSGETVTIAGYLVYPDIPDGYTPLSWLQQIPFSELSEPVGKARLNNITAKHMLAWYTPDPIPPVYTDNAVIQQTPHGTVIATPDLTIRRCITNDYDTALLSSGGDGLIYIWGYGNGKNDLTAFTVDGIEKYTRPLDPSHNPVFLPPMVSAGNKVFCCTEKGFILIDEAGMNIQRHHFPDQNRQPYPVLYNETLVVGSGTTIVVYDNSGEIRSIHSEPLLGCIKTPCVVTDNRALVVGSENGLYALTWQ